MSALDSDTHCTCAAGGAFGMAAVTFSKALCTSLAQLRAVYAEAEHAGISLGDSLVHLAGVSLSSHLTTTLRHCMYTYGYTVVNTLQSIEMPMSVLSPGRCAVIQIFACSASLPWFVTLCQDRCPTHRAHTITKMQLKPC